MKFEENVLLHRCMNGDLNDAELADFYKRVARSTEMSRALVWMSVDELLAAEIMIEDKTLAESSSLSEGPMPPAVRPAGLFSKILRLPRWQVWTAAAACIVLGVAAVLMFRPKENPPPIVVQPKQAPRRGEAPRPRPVDRRPVENLAQLFNDVRRVQAEMDEEIVEWRRAEELAKTPKASPAPERREEPVVREPNPGVKETGTAVARLEEVEGAVFVVPSFSSNRTIAERGKWIFTGQRLQTVGPLSQAVIRYEDGTLVTIGSETSIRPLTEKRVSVERGTLRAQVAKQPPDHPLTFVTEQIEAKVIGTELAIFVSDGSTALQVAEGRVRVDQAQGGKSVEVPQGYCCLAFEGELQDPKPIKDMLRSLIEQVKPKPEEQGWKALPWHASLRDAYKVAAAEHKPIYLLVTDGDLETANCSAGAVAVASGPLSNPAFLAILQKNFVCAWINPIKSPRPLKPDEAGLLERLRQQVKDVSDEPDIAEALELGGERELFATPDGRLIGIFASAPEYRTEESRLKQQKAGAPLPYKEEFLQTAIRRSGGQVPRDWKDFVDGTVEPPAPPSFERLYGAVAGGSQKFAVYVRNSNGGFESLRGYEVISASVKELEALAAGANPRPFVELPRPLLARLGRLFYGRGNSFIQLNDSAVDGTLKAQIREISGGKITGSLLGDIYIKMDDLEKAPNPRLQADTDTLRFSLAGDFTYDAAQSTLTSFRLVTYADCNPPQISEHKSSRLTVAVELLQPPQSPAPPPQPKKPPAMPERRPGADAIPPAPPPTPNPYVIPVPGKPGFFMDPKTGQIIPPGAPAIAPSGPVVPNKPK